MLKWYFSVGSVSDKIVSALTQTEIKFVPRWLSVHPDVHEKNLNAG
jgi:hypothetical protein